MSVSFATAAMSPAGHLGDRGLLLAAHRRELVEPLLAHGATVHERRVVLHGALEHLEEVDAPDVRVDDRLEHERGRWAVADRRCRAFLDHEVREPVDPDELGRTSAQHREHAAFGDALRERVPELVDRQRLVGEVALHEVVVGDDDALDERVVHRVLLGRHVVGHRPGRTDCARAVVGDGLVGEQVDDAAEGGFLADRELERRDAGAELVLQLIERALERRALAVELVHEDRARHAARLGEPPRGLGLHLDAFDGRHDEDRQVGGPQRRRDVADEVGVPRRVEHVDLVALELEGCEGERHRDVALLLLGIEVAHRRAVLDATHAGDRAGGEEQRFGERGLARASVAYECDVAHLLGRVRLHGRILAFSGRMLPVMAGFYGRVRSVRQGAWYPACPPRDASASALRAERGRPRNAGRTLAREG